LCQQALLEHHHTYVLGSSTEQITQSCCAQPLESGFEPRGMAHSSGPRGSEDYDNIAKPNAKVCFYVHIPTIQPMNIDARHGEACGRGMRRLRNRVRVFRGILPKKYPHTVPASCTARPAARFHGKAWTMHRAGSTRKFVGCCRAPDFEKSLETLCVLQTFIARSLCTCVQCVFSTTGAACTMEINLPSKEKPRDSCSRVRVG
jgi:hypothetical protein